MFFFSARVCLRICLCVGVGVDSLLAAYTDLHDKGLDLLNCLNTSWIECQPINQTFPILKITLEKDNNTLLSQSMNFEEK